LATPFRQSTLTSADPESIYLAGGPPFNPVGFLQGLGTTNAIVLER